MSPQITTMTDAERRTLPSRDDAGLGALRTERGNLPLERLDLRARIAGLLAHTELEQGFHNPYDQPLEATYVFPLPDRAAVTGMRMAADDRVIEAELRERGQARAEYERAVAAGQRAAIAEEERPDVFTMRVGNILPGERVTITLTLAGPLSYEDGEAAFRFPLVVAPRYIPGEPVDGTPVGSGYARDTDAVPDASRITPPVLLPGFPHPVRLGIEVNLDPGGLPLAEARTSLPVERTEHGWRVVSGQRADQDFVLRLRYGDPVHTSYALVLGPDADGPDALSGGEAHRALSGRSETRAGAHIPDRPGGNPGVETPDLAEGTFQLTVLPPNDAAPPRPRDVVLVLDRSGSMRGWKMAAARRAAARIVDTLTGADRFAVLAFDNVVERPVGLPEGLVAATDRHRYRAVEHLARVEARGGTELLTPLREALALLSGDPERDRVLVLVTDGQVGNEDQILREADPAKAGVRVHTIGIDKAVNAGFLGRLAAAGGGRSELVESEDRLDEAAERIHRRIGAPLVTGLRVDPDGIDLVADTVAPARMPDLFPGAPLVLAGRYRGAPGRMVVRGTDPDGKPWQATVEPAVVDNPALAPVWARAHLRDLEDRYVTADRAATTDLERRIVATSLRFSVLCRFTAYVAVDRRTVTDGGEPHRVIQPVEPAAGWDMLAPPVAAGPAPLAVTMAAPGSAELAGGSAGGMIRFYRGAQRPRRRRPPKPTPAQPLPAELAAEAARMRAAAGLPERERRVLLADLASRLEVLLRGKHPESEPLARLRRLLERLPGDAALRVPSDEFARLWRELQELLDELAGAAPSPPPREFWKRTS